MRAIPRQPGSGNWLTRILVAVLAAALAAGRLLACNGPGSGGSGISLPGSGAVPAPGSSAAQLSGGEQAIVTKVKPGLTIINTTPRYDSEAATETGMVINADGLVLTSNHVIDDSTKITDTVASTARPTRWWATTRPGTSPYPAAERIRADDGTDRQLLLGQGRIRRHGPGQRPGPGHHHRHSGPGHRAEAGHHREQRGRRRRLRNAGRNGSGKRRRRARRLSQPASGDVHVLGLHAAPTGTPAGSERFGPGPSGQAFHAAGLPDTQSRSAVLPMPLPPQHQHPAQLVTGRRQRALQRERSLTGWPAYGVHANSAVSFSVLPAIAHVSVRVALAASQLRLPASRKSANQPGRHALSARAAMTPCPAGAQVRRHAIPPRRDCSHRSVADRRNSSGRTSSPQRCMSPGPSGTPVSFGA